MADADPPRPNAPGHPDLQEGIDRPCYVAADQARPTPEFLPPELTETLPFWSGTGAADDLSSNPPSPRPISASMPLPDLAAAVPARDAPAQPREHVAQRPPPEPPPPPWESSASRPHEHAARAAGKLGADPEPDPLTPASALDTACAARAALARQHQHASARPLPEPPPRPWGMPPDFGYEDDDGASTTASAEPGSPDRWPYPPTALPDCADYACIFNEVEGQMRRDPEDAYSFEDFIADVGDDLFLFLADSPDPPGSAHAELPDWDKDEDYTEDDCVYEHVVKRFLPGSVEEGTDPLLSSFDDGDGFGNIEGPSECPVGLLMTFPLMPVPRRGRQQAYKYDEKSRSTCICSYPEPEQLAPWPHPRRPSAPPWISHFSQGSLFLNRAFVLYREDWTHFPPSPPQTSRPLLGAEQFRFLAGHPDRKKAPPQDPATSQSPRVSSEPASTRRAPPLPEPPILRQVRGLWRNGAISKPTYTAFANQANTCLQRHRTGTISDSVLQTSLLDLFSALDYCLPARRRPRPSWVAKRPRPTGQQPRRNKPFTAGASGLRAKTRNNFASRRRHRREHRLVVGRSRLRRHDSVFSYGAPELSMLDRKRAAKSVAMQAARLHPTTQRLRPSRRRRRWQLRPLIQ